MTQPLLQCVSISPTCSAVGGAHWVAAWRGMNPFTLMKLMPVVPGKHSLPGVDLRQLSVGIDVPELGPQRGRLRPYLAIPERRSSGFPENVLERLPPASRYSDRPPLRHAVNCRYGAEKASPR